ncbi:MAG: response regulator [Alphaproteobacteria bacterium]|nr:response regulator [Alphaproteobacteria bacterium]
MAAVRGLSGADFGIATGPWRWAALGLFSIALAAGLIGVAMPAATGWLGVALLAAIGAVAALVMVAMWPRESVRNHEARRIAEAAARANVAWAITSPEGAVLDCNEVYRRLSGANDGKAAPPPELALAGESSSDVLYRLARSAAAGESREEPITISPGVEVVAAVRPMAHHQSAWWFTPRLADHGTRAAVAPTPAQPSRGPALGLPALSGVFREAPVGVAIAHADGTIIDANESFRGFFGHDVIGQSISRLVEADDTERVAALVAQAGQGDSSRSTELRAAGQDERMAEMFVRLAPESDRILLYLLDVSEQRALETKFAQSQKMQAVGQLAGGVAHDFNNLLTVIIGNSEFLLMRHPAGDSSFKEINEIHQNALRAAALVGQLLAFSRKQTLQPRTLNLRDMLSELAIMLRRLVREGMEVKLDHGPKLWPVHADEAQSSNAIINLVVNARDAMPEGGQVVIRTANETVSQPAALGSALMPPGDYVRIDVSDTGIGIAKEHVGKIFDPFFTTKPVGHGTGLGLATVYGIVKQSGGFISVHSEIGRGTTFTIYLPRQRSESATQAEPERPVPRDMTGQDTILLVEDEEAVRSFAARALKLRGYNVIEAAGGEEALDIVRSSPAPIHLLITDVVMPNMDGPTLVRNARGLRPDMQIIFMSGYAEDTFRRNDEKAEDLHFLPKPFGLKQLAAKVKDVLSHQPAPVRHG